MNQTPYLYNKEHSTRYHFISIGKRPIEKIVEFTRLQQKNLYNLSFGDLESDDNINDNIKSNNGDIIKVLSTVIHIVKDFTAAIPTAKIAFKGSTAQRTALYQRIIKMYLEDFKMDFFVTTLVDNDSKYLEVSFDKEYKGTYLAFFIERKS
ncbi:MAG: hypothetical protein ABJA78_15475 [Ferruginibacter sp.]